MAAARPSEIPQFITARSKLGLRRLMLKTNVKLKMTVQYFDIQQDLVTKEWVAWYYARPQQEDQLFNDVDNGTE
jgi:hypothetical protein